MHNENPDWIAALENSLRLLAAQRLMHTANTTQCHCRLLELYNEGIEITAIFLPPTKAAEVLRER
jgi:hypothetical protein